MPMALAASTDAAPLRVQQLVARASKAKRIDEVTGGQDGHVKALTLETGPSGTRPDSSLASSSDTVEGHTDPLSEHVHRCRRVAMISADFSSQN